jgi:hypothetical protein
VWLEPHLFGLEVKQGKARATERQLARLVSLRKHHVNAWIVRSPEEATTIIQLTLEGLTMAFNDDLLAELDAALAGRPATAEAPVAAPAELPSFDEPANPQDTLDAAREALVAEEIISEVEAVEVVQNGIAVLEEAAEVLAEDNDALERVANALEALVLEIRMLNVHVAALAAETVIESDPVQTAAAPTPRTRRRRAPEPPVEDNAN